MADESIETRRAKLEELQTQSFSWERQATINKIDFPSLNQILWKESPEKVAIPISNEDINAAYKEARILRTPGTHVLNGMVNLDEVDPSGPFIKKGIIPVSMIVTHFDDIAFDPKFPPKIDDHYMKPYLKDRSLITSPLQDIPHINMNSYNPYELDTINQVPGNSPEQKPFEIRGYDLKIEWHVFLADVFNPFTDTLSTKTKIFDNNEPASFENKFSPVERGVLLLTTSLAQVETIHKAAALEFSKTGSWEEIEKVIVQTAKELDIKAEPYRGISENHNYIARLNDIGGEQIREILPYDNTPWYNSIHLGNFPLSESQFKPRAAGENKDPEKS
jgi:hypothetical protein